MSLPPFSSSGERELLDRLRRMETRLTKLMEFLGLDVQVRRARWEEGRGIIIPSRAVALSEVLSAFPRERPGDIAIMMDDGKIVATMSKW